MIQTTDKLTQHPQTKLTSSCLMAADNFSPRNPQTHASEELSRFRSGGACDYVSTVMLWEGAAQRTRRPVDCSATMNATSGTTCTDLFTSEWFTRGRFNTRKSRKDGLKVKKRVPAGVTADQGNRKSSLFCFSSLRGERRQPHVNTEACRVYSLAVFRNSFF